MISLADPNMPSYIDVGNMLNNGLGNVQSQTTTIQQNNDGSSTVTQKHELGPQDQTQTTPTNSLYSLAPQTGGGLGLQATAPQTAAPMFNFGQQQPVTATPAAPAQPQLTPGQAFQQAATQTQIPQVATPSQGVQVAGNAAVPGALPAPTPVAPTAQQPAATPAAGAPAQTQTAPAATTTAPAATEQPAPSPEIQSVIDAHNEPDPVKRNEKMRNLIAFGTDAQQKMGLRMLGDDAEKVKQLNQAQEKIDALNPTDYGRYLSQRSKDGSWVRAVLLQGLGFHKEASDEMDKLGYGPETSAAEYVNGQHYQVIRGADGGVKRAFTEAGDAVKGKELSQIAANAISGATAGGTFYKDLSNGHTISERKTKGGDVIWRDEFTKQDLPTAPEHMANMGYTDPREKAAISAKKSVMDKMAAENTKARAQGAPEPFTTQQMQEAGQQAYQSNFYKPEEGTTVQTPTATAPATAPAQPAMAAPAGAARNNNPGNIRFGDFARAQGATGQDERGFAVFPDQSSGEKAQHNLLNGDAYKNMTLSQMVSKWAPNTDKNNPAQYARSIKQMTGLDMDKTYAELTPDEQKRFRDAQTRIEQGTGAVPAAPKNPIREQAEAIYNGDQPMPTGLGAANYRGRAVVDEVNKIAQERGKAYDPTVYHQRQDTEKKFNTGQQGNAVRSMNTAIDHMDTLREKIKKLPNGQYPAVNAIMSDFGRSIGDPRYNSYDAAAGLIAAEVTKAIVANGGTGDERAEKERLLAVQNNPEALRQTLNSYTQLLGGQLKELKQQYQAGHGNNWDAKINPRTAQAIAESKVNRAWDANDKQAADWVRANPNDPRADKVKQRLGLD